MEGREGLARVEKHASNPEEVSYFDKQLEPASAIEDGSEYALGGTKDEEKKRKTKSKEQDQKE